MGVEKKNGMRIFKIENQKVEIKQWTKEDNNLWVIEPNLSFNLLLQTYEWSFIVGWIIDKISKSCASGFEPTGNNKLDMFLRSIDTKFWFANILVFWNLFLEKVKNLKWDFSYFEPFLTTTMKVKSDWSFVQRISKDIPFTKDEVVHIKTQSMRSKKYWESIFLNVTTQIALLSNIDTFYEKLFDKGLIYPFILNDEENKLTDEQCKDIQIMINDGLRWLENSFRWLVLPTKLSKMDLTTNIDNNVFIELRTQLIKSICVGINYPYWLVINDSSNKATSDTEFKALLKEIISPLQNEFLLQFKRALSWIKTDIRQETDIDKIFFVAVDVKNQLDEMRKWTGYKSAWILTANEVREQIWWVKMEWWNALETRMSPEQTKQTMDEVQKKVEKIYNK